MSETTPPTLDDVELPSGGWRALDEPDPTSHLWMTPAQVAVRLVRVDSPSQIPMDLDGARAGYVRDSGQLGGALIEVESVDTSAGTVLRSVFKYAAPNNPRAMYCVGVVLLSYDDVHLRVHTEAMETGTTGGREAAVMVTLGDGWKTSVPTGDGLVRNPADDAQWDASFPDHPLSRVRAEQRRILEALAVNNAPRPCG